MNKKHYVTTWSEMLKLRERVGAEKLQYVEGYGWREATNLQPTGNHYRDSQGNWRRKNVYCSEDEHAAM